VLTPFLAVIPEGTQFWLHLVVMDGLDPAMTVELIGPSVIPALSRDLQGGNKPTMSQEMSARGDPGSGPG
jgi:hypothetical protein